MKLKFPRKYTIPGRWPALALLLTAMLHLVMAVALPKTGFTDALNMAYLLIMPGWLVQAITGWRADGRAKILAQIPAFSVAYLMIAGFLANVVGDIFRISQPLGAPGIIWIVELPVIVLAAILAHRIKDQAYIWRKPRLRPRFTRWLLPATFPILAVMGTNLLNNQGPNTVIILMLAVISLYTLWLASLKHEPGEELYVLAIYGSALALLLMTSLRSWHITGYDINQEYQVFQLTKTSLHWSMAHLRDPYNACLSITILPTLFSQYLQLADEYIYKLVFQIIFAFMPVGLYLFSRQFVTKPLAFLAAFFFIAQVWFFQGMPTLIRQEFAIFFFIMLLGTIFERGLRQGVRIPLIMVYSLAMALSHYSTTYVAIAILTMAFTMYRLSLVQPFLKLARHIRRRPRLRNLPAVRRIRVWHIGLLISVALSWNLLITQTTGEVSRVLDNSSSNISAIFSAETLTGAFARLLSPEPKAVTITHYLTAGAIQFQKGRPGLDYYTAQEIGKLNLKLVSFTQAPAQFGPVVQQTAALGFKAVRLIANYAFIIIGVGVLYVSWRRGRRERGEYTFLGMAGFVLIALILIIPGALEEYNIERLYFQQLIIWAPASIIGGLACLRFIQAMRVKQTLLATLFILVLWFSSGAVFAYTGGPALISVTNYGEDYEKFYTHDQEVAAAQWLGSHYGSDTIFTSSVGRNKLWAYGNVKHDQIISETQPAVIDRNSYVFLTYINTMGQKGLFSENGSEYAYTYPRDFLNGQKDELYSNGVSAVYK